MRKILYYISSLSVGIIILAGFAEAQYPSTMQKQEKTAVVMKKSDQYFLEKQKKIDKKYEKAIKYVDDTSLSDEQKNLLRAQAEENRALAVRQLEERAALMKAHKEQKSAIISGSNTERDVKKAMKKIKEILKN